MTFNSSPTPTVGIELELALVDQSSLALANCSEELLQRVPRKLAEAIKPELTQCCIEVNSTICPTIDQARDDLRNKIQLVESIADDLQLHLAWIGTHPFSSWREQQITRNDRYQGLVNLLQDTARQLITFGLHVHVGVDGGDKAIMICDRILRHLPTLLAASANSPFWEGRNTGMHSWRSKLMHSLPTAGLPPLMRNWSEYVWLVNHLVATGFIETMREIWWDVRPHHNFGTVEVRICDIPGNLEHALALAALIQALIKNLSDEIDRGTYQHDCHPMLVRQNKWRAARYGLDAQLVDSQSFRLQPAREVLAQLTRQLCPVAEELGSRHHLERLLEIATEPTWAERQIQPWKNSGQLPDTLRHLIPLGRLRPTAKA